MDPGYERTGPVTSGTGSEIISGQPKTFRLNVPQGTDIPHGRDYERGFCAGWAERAEYARRSSLTFEDGVEFGYAMADRALRNAIAEAAAPLPDDAAEVVHRLVRIWDVAA